MLQLLIPKPLRLVRRLAHSLATLFLVRLEIPFAPVDVAVAFEGQNVRRQAIQEPAVVADDHGAPGEIRHGLF
jgi:hypothetical protein